MYDLLNAILQQMIREITVGRYHFFIAYASPDFRQARDLYFKLQDELRDEPDKVFFDRQQIQPGDPWPPRLSEALAASRAVVVLISSHTRAAFYEQEEIARAIQLARQQPDRHTMIPVLLESLPEGPEGLPYGMNILQALDATWPGGLESAWRLNWWIGLLSRMSRERNRPALCRRPIIRHWARRCAWTDIPTGFGYWRKISAPVMCSFSYTDLDTKMWGCLSSAFSAF
ncbi:toll/interleukin-1 receptor domain-containing protein [Candidatus Entotheonella palauensis]|uniref:toll/interleukin-1 receptor domain-containing protein n=1 Tax=Candidatus Entotheonella palauensis TaxID=93172 RepID=UPI0015C46CF6|nr:toll/interleukin-1 receptor domain-containing protein [Candidatus Entotheonella palauensis]